MTECLDLALKGVKLITVKEFVDDRGQFKQLYSESDFSEVGIFDRFVQDNQSFSINAGTLRGLHAQAPPYAQAKLVQCTKGRIFDVVVDARADSNQFGKWCGVELSQENAELLYVPEGFLHGFVTLVDGAEVTYKVSAPYKPQSEVTVLYNDGSLNIDWPAIPHLENFILSEKDAQGAPFSLVASKIDPDPKRK